MENIETHREMFDLPKWVFPIALLCFGYPLREERDNREKTPRFSEQFVYFKNKYRHVDIKKFEREFSERFINKENLFNEAPNVGSVLYLRKTGSYYAAEMRRSVNVALSDWCE